MSASENQNEDPTHNPSNDSDLERKVTSEELDPLVRRALHLLEADQAATTDEDAEIPFNTQLDVPIPDGCKLSKLGYQGVALNFAPASEEEDGVSSPAMSVVAGKFGQDTPDQYDVSFRADGTYKAFHHDESDDTQVQDTKEQFKQGSLNADDPMVDFEMSMLGMDDGELNLRQAQELQKILDAADENLTFNRSQQFNETTESTES